MNKISKLLIYFSHLSTKGNVLFPIAIECASYLLYGINMAFIKLHVI